MYSDNVKVLLVRKDLVRLGINVSNSTMLRWEAAGRFPKRVRVGDQSVAWLASEIHEHVANLAASRQMAA